MTDKNTDLTQIKLYTKRLFDIVKYDVNANECYFVLFLLVLHKERLLKGFVILREYNVLDEIYDNIRVSSNHNTKLYLDVWELFKPQLLRVKSTTICEILDLFDQFESRIIDDSFAELFDDVLYNLIKLRGRSGRDVLLPVEINKFILSLAELPNNAIIYNPFAGFASFGVLGREDIIYLGQELNNVTWALGQLRIIAYDRKSRSELINRDSITDWNLNYSSVNQKYDLIISNPPLNKRAIYPFYSGYGYFRKYEIFFIERGLDDLAYNGKMIAIVPHEILYKKGESKELRRLLIERDFLEMIISFPNGLMINSSIPFAVLVINKDKKNKGYVEFIDAYKTVETTSFREKRVNINLLNGILKNDLEPEFKKNISNVEITELDYSLNISMYFQNTVDGIQLNQIVTQISTFYDTPTAFGKLVRFKELKADKINKVLDIESLENVQLPNDALKISQSCVLVALKGERLNPTFFEFSGESIFIAKGIIALKVDKFKADITYLIKELEASYVIEQINVFKFGKVIPAITKSDLLKVKVILPSLDIQKARVAGVLETLDAVEVLRSQNESLDYEYRSRNFDEFASLKHTLGRPRQNILDWAENILYFINSNPGRIDSFNRDFASFYDKDIITALNEIKRDVNFITEVLEKGANGLVLSEYRKQLISLDKVNAIISNISSNGFNFKINLKIIGLENRKKRGVFINEILFITLLDNLLTNANKYAFDSRRKENKVVIELSEIDDFLTVDIKNNGAPFPRNFDKSKFITKYSTADSNRGSGLGGYDINRIATYFGNEEWFLILNEDPFYPVHFRFQFRIQLID